MCEICDFFWDGCRFVYGLSFAGNGRKWKNWRSFGNYESIAIVLVTSVNRIEFVRVQVSCKSRCTTANETYRFCFAWQVTVFVVGGGDGVVDGKFANMQLAPRRRLSLHSYSRCHSMRTTMVQTHGSKQKFEGWTSSGGMCDVYQWRASDIHHERCRQVCVRLRLVATVFAVNVCKWYYDGVCVCVRTYVRTYVYQVYTNETSKWNEYDFFFLNRVYISRLNEAEYIVFVCLLSIGWTSAVVT